MISSEKNSGFFILMSCKHSLLVPLLTWITIGIWQSGNQLIGREPTTPSVRCRTLNNGIILNFWLPPTVWSYQNITMSADCCQCSQNQNSPDGNEAGPGAPQSDQHQNRIGSVGTHSMFHIACSFMVIQSLLI